MNTKGNDFVESVKKRWDVLPNEIKRFKFSESRIDEQIMRLGIEVKAYEANPDEYETLSLAVIKNRILKDFDKHGVDEFFLEGTIE